MLSLFLSLHALAEKRGDGLHADILALLKRRAAAGEIDHTDREVSEAASPSLDAPRTAKLVESR